MGADGPPGMGWDWRLGMLSIAVGHSEDVDTADAVAEAFATAKAEMKDVPIIGAMVCWTQEYPEDAIANSVAEALETACPRSVASRTECSALAPGSRKMG